MELVLLGTGCPQVDTGRYGPATMVRHGDATVLVDCGSGVTQRLLAAGTRGADIDVLLLTHLHSDHTVDLFQLVISSWHQGRDRPQRVLGPPGTRRFVERTMETWRPDLEQRIAHERRPTTRALEVEVTEYGEGPVWSGGGLAVRAVRVDHRPVREAFGFVFEADGARLAVSGDTTWCPALIEAARGADVLVHECFVHGAMKPIPGIRSAEGIDAVASYHTLSSVVGKVAREAGVRVLVLTHFVPVRFDREALLAEIRRDFAGPVVVGEDLMRLSVPGLVLRAGDAAVALASP